MLVAETQISTPLISNCNNSSSSRSDLTEQMPDLSLSPNSSTVSSSASSSTTQQQQAKDEEEEETNKMDPISATTNKTSTISTQSTSNNKKLEADDDHGNDLTSMKNATKQTATDHIDSIKSEEKGVETIKQHNSQATGSTASSSSSSSSSKASSRRPVFSSDEEEPIVMSRDAFASAVHDVELTTNQEAAEAMIGTEEEGTTIVPHLLPTTITTTTSHQTSTNNMTTTEKKNSSFFFWNIINLSNFDISYKTSSLTRNNNIHLDGDSSLTSTSLSLSSSSSTTSIATIIYQLLISMIFNDFLQMVAIQKTPILQWPNLWSRMIQLIWYGGPDDSNTRRDIAFQQHSMMITQKMKQQQQQQQQQLPNRTVLPPVVHGIPNFGQTCFLNVILQSMASLDSVLAYSEWIASEQQQRQIDDDYLSLLEEDENDDEYMTGKGEGYSSSSISRRKRQRNRHRHRRRHHKPEPTTTVSQILFPMLQALNGQNEEYQKNDVIDPRGLLFRVAQKNTQFQSSRHLFGMKMSTSSSSFMGGVGGEQQDAQELLQALLEMMIVDAELDDPYTIKLPPPNSNTRGQSQEQRVGSKSSEGMVLSDYHQDVVEEKKEDSGYHDQLCLGGVSIDDDEILTVLSDRLSPKSSSNSSYCSSVGSDDEHYDDEHRGLWSSATGKVEHNNNTDTAWNHVQMVDATGMIGSYSNMKLGKGENVGALPSQSNKPMENSLASSFLSTTSTVVTSPAAHARERRKQHEDSSALSASMQIMLSTISSITKTPLSCWTGSLVQCQKCRHVKAVRNQEWRDIPVVPTAVSEPMMTAARGMGSSSKYNEYTPPPCTLEECLRNFTQVERVEDVECGNCTLQVQIDKWQEEVDLLRGAVESLERKREKQQLSAKTAASNNSDSGSGSSNLRAELEQAELTLLQLRQQDPDEYDPCKSLEFNEFDDSVGSVEKMLRANALKCLVLTRLPSVLCLHVQRRCYDPMTNRMSKTMQHVVFDEFLDLAPYCAFGGNEDAYKFFNCQKNGGSSNINGTDIQQRSPILYRLTSVVEHRGNAFGGHYVCYRRLPARFAQSDPQKAWFFCSDVSIQQVTWSQVRTAQAYMLFYEAV